MTYDLLSVNIGITPKPINMPVAATSGCCPYHVTAVKPIAGFANRWDHTLQRVKDAAASSESTAAAGSSSGDDDVGGSCSSVGHGHGDAGGPAVFNIVIVGGGAGGVELAFAMHHRYTARSLTLSLPLTALMCIHDHVLTDWQRI